MLELSDLELRHQEAPDLQGEQRAQPPGQPPAEAHCLTQLLEASFSDLQGEGSVVPSWRPWCSGGVQRSALQSHPIPPLVLVVCWTSLHLIYALLMYVVLSYSTELCHILAIFTVYGKWVKLVTVSALQFFL